MKYFSKIIMMAIVIVQSIALYPGVQSSALYAAEWVNVSGTVYYNGQPLSVMVLANGQYEFTDGTDGKYDLNVPLDGNGQITLFSFCDGLAPFKATLNSWEAGYYQINMSAADSESKDMSITAAKSDSEKDGWVRLTGKVLNQKGESLCAMVLANGQNTFSSDDNGSYTLDVPLDSNNNITLFGFCDGMLPYKQIIHIPPSDDSEYILGDTGKPADYEQSVFDFAMFDDFDSDLDQLPPQFDWRDRGAVTPAKDQGSCGSCWAFAAVGVLESKIRINGGLLHDLSEQQQVSCNTKMLGCLGGGMDSLKFWYSRGPMNETCAEYVQSDAPCSDMNHCEKLAFATDRYYTIDDNLGEEEYIRQTKYSLNKDGPAYFRYDVYPDFHSFWKSYSPGKVYRNSGGFKTGGHAVMLIGWNDTKGAWLCKNSWGTTAGPNGDGSFWIAYSGHARDLGFAMANVKLVDENVSSYAITAMAEANGIIEPSGVIRVDEGKSQTFTFTPDIGYKVANVSVDGSSVGSVPNYTFKTIAADHVIHVTFQLVSKIPPIANAGADLTNVAEGEEITLNGLASDSDGYIVSYFWEQVGGFSADDFASSSATLTFTVPYVGTGGTDLTFRLTVTDNDGLTASDTCVIQVTDGGSGPSLFTNSLGMKFEVIPAGTFMMGSPADEPETDSDEDQHQVTLTQAFYMQTTEVTQEQWKAVMGNNPSSFQSCGDDCPVDTVSWDDVQEFVIKMNQQGEGTYRLPTEAEWEYAAGAGSTTAFYNGGITETGCEYDPNLDAIAWYCGNSDDKTHQAAQKQANAWGLYDMSGNVWEWVQDWHGDYPTGAVTNPTGPTTGSYQVIRGGSWNSNAKNCRIANRNINWHDYRGENIGFRLVMTP